MENLSQHQTSLRIFVGLLIVCAVAYLLLSSKKATESEISINEALQQQVVSLQQKLSESEANYAKLKSEKTSKTKRLVTNADGSSVLVEKESSELNDSEVADFKTKTAEYLTTISQLQSSISEIQKVHNDFVRLNFNGVYDSDRGLEWESNASYKIYSGSAGVNPERQAWRVGAGFGFSF